ncbi:hypothetical protein Clim_0648 [Chlorobium limicola DSM 245]|uniref:DUF4145 domain-containing protein n=1 Tax=Chlorobium limicola (strain DSM 245 / NBRC 103803 / 6330) TaxID=290315 RepID=B3EH54_CHLL2|nr:hypothetical protein [Chlorobium limicola]ACD89734.1 hypothetical protein Clim_0648 [Chlorobium limicola DSM 245]
MNPIIITNVEIYKAVANEAYEDMVLLSESGRRLKSDGSAGFIITYDPTHASFKKAMISLVFTGMWLEALMHLLIVRQFGEAKFKEYDFKSYEEKLKLLGVEDKQLLDRTSRFRVIRKALVHEKAHFDDGEMKTAQSEAKNAHQMLQAICEALGPSH